MACKPLDHVTKRQILEESGPDFLQTIVGHVEQPMFLAHLVKHKVISPEKSKDISDVQKSSEKAQLLLNHLHQCSVQQFIAFCIVLHDEADRADILTDIFKVDVQELRQQRELSAPIPPPPCPSTSDPSQNNTDQAAPSQPPRYPSTSAPNPSSTIDPEAIRIISDHARGCLRLLMHHNLYDIGDSPSAKVIHTGKVYIKVDTQHEMNDGKLTEIPEEDMLRCLPGESSLRVVQVHGPPGAGKTALAEYVVCDWAKKFLENVERFGLAGFDKDLFTTMVFIPSRAIKHNMDEAIMEHLLCQEKDKKVLFNHIKQGNGIGMALDAIDEIRNATVLKEVKRYLKYQHTSGDGTRILVTTRSDLGQIESTNFDRFLVLQGFTWDQGCAYIKVYFHDDKSEKVLLYTQAHQQQLFSIVTNPLRLHIYCALISEGELKLDENDDLSILHLFQLLEKCLIRRKGVKVTEEQCRNMYRMCMHGLLHGVRHFSQELFDEFNIAEGSHVFFIRKTSPLGSEVSYSFPHEMMYEYFAGRYIESLSLESKKALLLSLCTNPAFRNLQKIIFEVLLQLGQWQLLQMLTRAILILQHEYTEKNKLKGLFQRFTLYGKLVKLHKQIQPLETLDLSMLGLQSQKNAKEINKIWNIINNVFDDKSSALKNSKWYLGLGNGVFGHITECFQACSPDLRASLTKNTTDHLLPCEYQDRKRRRFVCAVGESRWAEVTFNKANGTVSVNAWTAEDAMEALYQARLSALPSGESHRFDSLTLNINQYRNLWGQPPSSSSSQESKYSDELQQWSTMCERFQFPCSAEMSHNANVVFHPGNNKIDVQAKSIQDAKEALHQVRLSAVDPYHMNTYNSMTISVNEQPPSDNSLPAGDEAQMEELSHWLHICKSHWFEYTFIDSSVHSVYALGTSRYAQVVYRDDKIHIHSWCLADAKDALFQARQSAATSPTTHKYSSITLHVDEYRNLWGQPSTNTFSKEACEGLNAELQQWTALCEMYCYY